MDVAFAPRHTLVYWLYEHASSRRRRHRLNYSEIRPRLSASLMVEGGFGFLFLMYSTYEYST